IRIRRRGERGAHGGGACRFAGGPAQGFERVLTKREGGGAAEHAAALRGDGPAATAADVERDQAGAMELPEDRAPFGLAVLLADPESGQSIVAEFEDRLGALAAEQVGQMLGAETLAGAHHGGK